MSTALGDPPPRADVRAVFDLWPRGVLIASGSRDGTLTCTLPGAPGTEGGPRTEPVVVRIPTSQRAVRAVEQEARLLVELRRRRLGPIERTIPRHVGIRQFDGRPVAMSSVVPGRPMTADHHRRWLRAARPDLARRDLRWAATWLADFQDASAGPRAPSTWAAEVVGSLRDRWSGHALLGSCLVKLDGAAQRLDGHLVDRTAVHGDFCAAHVLTDRGGVSGVVGWARGEPEGWPLRDLTRFAVRYAQHLERHPWEGRGGAGRVGTAQVGVPGLRPALGGSGLPARALREYLCQGLVRLGVPSDRWYAAALVGVAEVAAQDDDERVAAAFLTALHDLPARP